MGTEATSGRGRRRTRIARLFALPEANFFVFGYLVHYPWELLQTPLFAHLAEVPHWQGVKFCSAAALGDALLTLVAYWIAASTDGRRWMLDLGRRAVAVYLAAGLLATVGLEWLNTTVLGRWEYSPVMPTLPLLGTGLSPLVQWILLPLLVLGIVHRQLQGERTAHTS